MGMAEAARRVGHGTDVVLAVEQRPDAAQMFARNFPRACVLEADVAALFDGAVGSSPTAGEARLRARIGTVDVLLAGPPCQGHSDLNNHTRREDPRNDLYVRVARAAEVLLPISVLVENVATIEHDRGSAVPRATAVLERAGYRVATAVLDLSELGVPQRRRRHILLASRYMDVDPAAILSARAACECDVPRTIEWAIADLLDVGTTSGVDKASVPSPENLARMMWLIDHDEYDLPNGLRPKCHHAPHSYLSMYGRLRWDGPAQTITTGYGSMGQLRLAAGSLRRGDEGSGAGVGGGGAVVGRDQVEAHVDSGGHAGRGEDIAVVDVELVGPHVDLRVPALQPAGQLPVGGRRTPVEQAGRGERERSRADGDEPGTATAPVGARTGTRPASRQQDNLSRPKSYRCPRQVLPWLLLLVPSGQLVLDQITLFRFAPVRLAPVRLAPLRLAFARLAPDRSAPDRLAPVRLAPLSLAWLRLVPVRLAPLRLAADRSAPDRSAPDRLTPDRLQPARVAHGVALTISVRAGEVDAAYPLAPE